MSKFMILLLPAVLMLNAALGTPAEGSPTVVDGKSLKNKSVASSDTAFNWAVASQFSGADQARDSHLGRDWPGRLSAPSGPATRLVFGDPVFLRIDGLPVASGIDQRGGGVDPLFFADVFQARSGVRPTCQDCTDALRPSPEPASLLLFGTTLAGIGLVVRRSMRRSAKSPDDSL